MTIDVVTIDVVIPSFNGATWLMTVLPEIKPLVRRVIVVDGGSEDGSQELCEHLNVEVVQLDGNPGFPLACNKGFEASDADAVLLLNNDVAIEDRDAVEKLAAKMTQGVKIVGACGAFLLPDFDYAGKDFTEPGLPYDYIPFWCALIDRKIYLDLGGLDESFGLGYSEDVDFCMRAETLGYKMDVAPCGIRHLSKGAETLRTIGFGEYDILQACRKNMNLLMKKHRLPRILVVRLDAYGDILMTAPAVKALRVKYPHSTIYWLARPGCHEAVEMCDVADYVLQFGDPGTMKFLETERLDLLFNFNDYPLNLDVRLRFKGRRIYGSHMIQNQVEGAEQVTYYNRCWRVGKEITTQRVWHALCAGVTLDSEAPPIAKRYLMDRSVALPNGKPLVALHGGSGGGDAKCMIPTLYAEIVEDLNQCGYCVILLGHYEHDYLCAEACKGLDVVNLVRQTRFSQLPGVLTRCKGVISTDSAIRHVAVGCGVKSLGIFTLADPKSCGNYIGHTDVQSMVYCSPCWEVNGDFNCCMTGRAHLQCWKTMRSKDIVAEFQKMVAR